jgi:hypothetical protein
MRSITGMAVIAFIYTAVTSRWVLACNEILQMMNLRNVAPEAVPGFARNIWKYGFLVFMRYTNRPILAFSILLLCAALITKLPQLRDDLGLT